MADIAGKWVSVAIRLSDTDLRRMRKLATAQGNRLGGAGRIPLILL
jgi:hypothetical protein